MEPKYEEPLLIYKSVLGEGRLREGEAQLQGGLADPQAGARQGGAYKKAEPNYDEGLVDQKVGARRERHPVQPNGCPFSGVQKRPPKRPSQFSELTSSIDPVDGEAKTAVFLRGKPPSI